MGGHEGWAQPNDFLPNGLLPNEAASVTRVLDLERWSRAEERTAELITRIQPNQPSEERRNAVACYVQRLMMKCFSCQVFTFGSVPLKTYLPDGDIDLTAFSKNQSLKDTWANEVRDMLESEENNEDAEFRVKEVQYIQAEVKLIKCLVENIVVDISFNQLGGLCTLCFLEQVDHLINQNHLFKRSIILIKAWCYYESRILGAHHGLISTYALETLVLYIFLVFNNSFAGPLEVLYRFLEFFSKFDWDNFCVSLRGPVPISSLPSMKADLPRKDGGELLLRNSVLDHSYAYAVLPGGQENHDQPFVSKHFNVIDPLRTNNNLGRSVSKGNFFRIRSAFAFGAQRLARLLDCPKEDLIAEFNQFFMNTWDRHGKGHRPDAPSPDLYGLRPVNLNHSDGSDSPRNYSSSKKAKENFSSRESEVPVTRASHAVSSQHGGHSFKQMSRTSNASTGSRNQSQKTYANLTSSVASDHNHRIAQSLTFNENTHTDKGRSSRTDNLGNEVHAKYRFARTYSSPELTDISSEVPSRGRRNRAFETGKGQTVSVRPDYSRSRNLGSEVSENHSSRLTEDPSSPRQSSSHQSTDAAVDLNSASNSFHGESGLGAVGEDLHSLSETMQMRQVEQDLVNMMASSRSFGGQVQMPLNIASAVPMPPSILASWGYAHRNSAGIVPMNIPIFDSPWGSSMHYSQGLVPFPVPQYFSSVGMASNREEIVEPLDDNLVSSEMNEEDSDHGFWSEGNADTMRGFDPENGSIQVQQLEEKNMFSSVGFNFVPSSRVSSSDSYPMKAHGLIKENRGVIRETYGDDSEYHIRGSDVHSTASSRFVSASQATSSGTKLSSEGSWDGSPSKVSKSTRDRRGRKSAPSTDPSTVYGLGNNGWRYEGESVDDHSSQADDDNRDWVPLSTVRTEEAESTVHGSAASSHVRITGYEAAQMSESNPMHPITPMLVGSGLRQRGNDNHGLLPFAFVPTGPPVPFLIYNFSTEGRTSGALTSHSNREGELHNCHVSQSDQNLDSTENLNQSEALMEPSEERKSDILNSDFASHWKNLQYGRSCQNLQNQGLLHYPSSFVVPPGYLDGHFPWDGPGSPFSANMNPVTQLMSYASRPIPVSSLQPGSNSPTGVYQHCAEEIPRYRGGTGTYLPNPKISSRDRQSSYTKNHRGNYYDRRDHHGDREGNWNVNPRPRFAGRGQGRNQVEKPHTRLDRTTANNSRSDRPWDSFKQDSFPPSYSQNRSFSSSNSSHRGPANVAYGMYPLPVVNPNGVSPSGSAMPSAAVLYPYDQNISHGSSAEQLEFGSLGRVHFSGINEPSQLGEGSSRCVNEQQNFQGDSAHSSPAQPSSPAQLSSPKLQWDRL
ncbi:hypothetical protein L1049_019398 [Liquidambar formosana]|uniref:Polymerase nucleotidyl transferase domain-containing protein n=1 Tax=Liquidambar formosana TaxID=63359 RepID=A0AAP0S5T0_LIQFO